MDDILSQLPLLIGLLLALLAFLIAADNVRRGLGRADADLSAKRQQVGYTVAKTEEMQRTLREVEAATTDLRDKIARQQSENAMLSAQLDSQELPFEYTVVAADSGDMYSTVWPYVARHPQLAEGAPPDHPAAQWATGRRYVVGSASQTDGRDILDRQIPRARGFDVLAVGAAVSRAPGT